jgi:GT2 family glycosyltransferase
MSRAQPPVDGPTLLTPAGPVEPVPAPPPVVAVVVTHDPGPWLEETLRSLTASDYPSLAVFVVDAGSAEDPTPRIAAVAPRAFVRRLPDDVGFAAAANEALAAVEGATFLLMCHDDVALDRGAVRVMVEEAFRSNAGIVGPKLVAHDDPELLLEVGLLVDRFGVPFSGIEPGELDQEQHDTVRDVFYVPSAAMLVRADLFHELGGFDPASSPAGEDLDLCWRALLVGARVLVAPDARVRHRRAGSERDEAHRAGGRLRARHRVRTVLKAYSNLTLAWVVPLGVVFALLEGAVLAVSGRVDRARAGIGAWTWNLRRLRDVRAARRTVQHARTVPDSDLRPLQVRGSAQLRRALTGRVNTEDTLRTLGETSRNMLGAARTGMREPLAIGVLAFVFLVLVGSRSFMAHGVPGVGAFLAWPGVGDLARGYGTAWRSVGLGSPAPASPALGMMASLGTVLVGATGLAHTVFVIAALPLGALGAARLTRRFTHDPVARFAAAIAYGVNPIVRNDLGTGRLGPLVLFALAPFVVAALVRLGWDERARRVTIRALVGVAMLVAVVTAFFPAGLAFPVAVGVAFVVASPLVGGARAAARSLGYACVATAGALVLLVPWSVSQLASRDAVAWGAQFRSVLDLADVLAFRTGPAGAGVGGWALLVAASLALVASTGDRLAWAARAWVLALLGFALVWLPARFAPGTSVPPPEGALVLAALGVSLSIGLGVAAFSHDLRTFRFGWRQLASVVGAVALALPLLGFVADVGSGSWHAPSTDWASAWSWMSTERSGGFRLLVLGDASVLPGDGVPHGETAYTLVTNGVLDARGLWPPAPRAGRLVGDAVDQAVGDRTSRLGHLLAPMGVRYVAVVDRSGPSGGSRVPVPETLVRGLDAQLDLARLHDEGTVRLYENAAWFPVRASVPGVDVATLRSSHPVEAGSRVELPKVRAAEDGTRVAPGALLLSETHDARWKATVAGHAVRHVETFGWANGWAVSRAGRVDTHFTGQLVRDLQIALEVLLWIAAAVTLWRLRDRRRARRGSAEAARERAQTRTPVPA